MGLISQNLAGVIIIVTDTGTGRGSGQGVSAAADWRPSFTIIIISIMGAELARLHTAAVRTVILQCDPATAAGVERVCADTPTHVVSSSNIVTIVGEAAGDVPPGLGLCSVNTLCTLSMAGLGLVQSLAVITHCLLRLPGALVTAAVVLGVPVTKSGVPADTIFLLLGTNVATPEPALFVGAVGWVAGPVAVSFSPDLVVTGTAVEDTIFTGCWCRVIIVRTGSMTELCFADCLSSGAHWIIGVSIPINPTVGAAILW